MNFQVERVGFSADHKLISYVTEKSKKLANFHDNIIQVKLFMKLGNAAKSIQEKIVKMRVNVPGCSFFVNSTSVRFEMAFDNALESVIKQINSKKEKNRLQKRKSQIAA